MKRGLTGTYQITSAGAEQVLAFVPAPLPPVPAIEIDAVLQQKLENATLALGRLDSVSLLLTDPNIFLYTYVRREAVLSSQIEGTQSTLADLLLFELEEAPGVPFDDVVEVSGYVSAMEHGITRLREGFPLSNRLIRELHGVLLSKGRGADQSPGEFRKSQNWIGGARPGVAQYVPPPAHLVEDCMADLERFIHRGEIEYSTLVKAALAHVQFESIHPFLDGNGRVGRLLIAFLLHSGGVLSEPLLYLSLYFKENRAEYYRLLDLVRTNGDWESWLAFFLDGVDATASNAVLTAKRLVTLFKEDTSRIQSTGRGASTTLRVFQALRERPVCTIGEIRRRTGLSFPTATSGVEKLAALDIVKEVTGRKRNRGFAYAHYLSILNEGTETA